MPFGIAIFILLIGFFTGAGIYSLFFFGVWNHRLKKFIKEQECQRVGNDEDRV